jgi:hypothetical protein
LTASSPATSRCRFPSVRSNPSSAPSSSNRSPKGQGTSPRP